MTLNDLSKIYNGNIMLTVNAYFENGEYYSFRSYGGEPMRFDDIGEDDMELEITSIACIDGVMWVDVKEIIPMKRKEEAIMTFEEYIKQMSHKELQNFIYWVYQNGWEDHSNGCEDSPGDWSFFGGAILNYPAADVIEKLDDYYGDDWRNE